MPGEFGADNGDALARPRWISVLASPLPPELPALGEVSREPLGKPGNTDGSAFLRNTDGEMVRTPEMMLEMNFLIELLPSFEARCTTLLLALPLSLDAPPHKSSASASSSERCMHKYTYQQILLCVTRVCVCVCIPMYQTQCKGCLQVASPHDTIVRHMIPSYGT